MVLMPEDRGTRDVEEFIVEEWPELCPERPAESVKYRRFGLERSLWIELKTGEVVKIALPAGSVIHDMIREIVAIVPTLLTEEEKQARTVREKKVARFRMLTGKSNRDLLLEIYDKLFPESP